jgi:hypothetical protein
MTNNKAKQYEQAIRSNMASAERDYKGDPEHRRGFVIGAVLKLWEVYEQDAQVDEAQFDRLIEVLSGFSNGEYRDFIKKQVADYKSGNPPIIIGY